MKKFYLYAIIIVAMVMATYSCAGRATAQETSIAQIDSVHKTSDIDRGTKTQYSDTIKGVVYPVYLSKGGKAFIWRTSKTGKEYKMYKPEIGKRINPQAYK